MYADEFQNIFIDECLVAHNKYRKLHGVPPLKHNPDLSDIALLWAKKIAKKGRLEHSGAKYDGKHLGENLAMWFMKGAEKYDGQEATDQWYEEIELYNFDRPGFTGATGHFTQVVWKGSHEVGFGVAIAPNGYFYAVANYFPAGNVMGEFDRNVFPIVITQQPAVRNPQRRGTFERDEEDDNNSEDDQEARRQSQFKTHQQEKNNQSSGCC